MDGSRQILPNSVGVTDGFGKLMIMVGITVIVHGLDSCLKHVYFTVSATIFLRLEFGKLTDDQTKIPPSC